MGFVKKVLCPVLQGPSKKKHIRGIYAELLEKQYWNP
jgi:hypothetical protein